MIITSSQLHKGGNVQVRFVRSFTTPQRTALLAACAAVIYTPPAEHFGIVPLEAMAASRPVIACNQAGPLETIVHGVTGLLCRPDPMAFADAMQTILVRLLLCCCRLVNHGRHAVPEFHAS